MVVLTAALVVARSLDAQIIRVAERTATELQAMDRARTAVLLPGGILEEHGPHLPSYSDGYLNERLTRSVAEAIVARPGWRALVFPTIPLGNSGANDIGARFSHSGTFAVRFETLRAIYMDLADELGAQGFRWVFVLHLHGAPNHNRALDEAGDYFRSAYGGRMVNLTGLMPVFASIEGPKSPAARAADGLPIHAGMDETSWMLHLRRDLVRPTYLRATTQSDSSMEGLVRLATLPSWPGYFGSPRLATAAHGAVIWSRVSGEARRVTLAILDGANPDTIPRLGRVMEDSPVDVRLDAASRQAESRRAARQEQWLRTRRRP
jgi:creatinine amidohydrolase/Fe(II)-dependent formamide hydrolase-like protein